MKLSTLAIAFSPAVLVLLLKFTIEPSWIKNWDLTACIALGAALGVFSGIAAGIIESQD